ncbi:MAG: GHKL domain-containing protein [Clostridiales bacterium]|nr:GHKL domain-containing protein [Clostridiales bacterium]
MSYAELLPLVAKFSVPGLFSMLFRIFGLGARSKKAAVIGLSVYLAVSIILPLVLIPTVSYDIYKRYCAIVMISANAAVFIISSDSFLKTCFMHFSQSNIVFWIATTFGAARRLLGVSYIALVISMALFCGIFYAVALRYFAKPLRFMADTIRSGWLGLLAVPACTVLAGVAMAVWFGTQQGYSTVMMIVVTALLEISFVMYMRGLYHSLSEITVLARENTRQKLLEAELSAYDDYLAAAKQSRHDLHHHNALVLDYLITGHTDEAIQYLRQANGALDEANLTEFSSNFTANAVLRVYSRQTKTKNISFAAFVDIPANLSLTAPELGALLSNLLENAVEACEQVTATSRYIAVTTQTDENGLRLEVRNSAACTTVFENEMPVSAKPGGGTGTKSIAHIVRTHGGMLRFKQENAEFITQIILPIFQ